MNDFFVLENSKHTTPLFGLHKVRGLFDKNVAPIGSGVHIVETPALRQTLEESMFPENASRADSR